MQKSLAGKVCVVAGGTAGIGRATARGLAERGARVVLPTRSLERGELVARELSHGVAHPVQALSCDLASQASIRAFAAAVAEEHSQVAVLVNSAGVVRYERSETEDGLEATFGVTYLGAFLLTQLLLPLLEAGAPARIVNVAGEFHRKVHLDFDDLNSTGGYDFIRVGARAMLAKVMFTFALARRLEGSGVTANCLHPGAVRSELLRDLPWYLRGPAALARPFMSSPETGARTPLYLATSAEVAEVSGEYFAKQRVKRAVEHAYDVALQDRLWNESLRLVGLAPEADSPQG